VLEDTHGSLVGIVQARAKDAEYVDDNDDDDDDVDDDDTDHDSDDEDGDGDDDLTLHTCMYVHVCVHAAQ
jgi:hypothetical protein